jgi:hypothetical protein
MLLSYLMLFVALCLSTIAAFYSIAGLAAIFAAAVIPIMIMGSVLEVAKLVVTVWLHEYWHKCRLLMKLYLVPAVALLMLITSMGIFGFLSKAHSDQSMVSGDVLAKIAVYDEKIKTAKDNIDANRKALKQLDDAVDQVMVRSTDEKGADKAVAIRRGQSKERARLLAEIETEQKKISSLNEERSPIAAEVRKVEAEVGPIKYIAALVYGDDPDANLLERAVRWVIILLVVVFDPLAVMMLLASTESMKWKREEPVKPQDDVFEDPPTAPPEPLVTEPTELQDPHPVGWMYPGKPEVLPEVVIHSTGEDEDKEEDSDVLTRRAKTLWKLDHPGQTLKEARKQVELGTLDHLPWEDYLNDPRMKVSYDFGTEFPSDPIKGDTFIVTTTLPTKLYKFNGEKWIEIDKTSTDQYAYNNSYIDHLISKIATGEYDPELLTDSERAQIQERLQQQEP